MNKINFQDIQAQHLNRYRLVKVDGTADEYDLTPVRGAVTQEGTPIRALELNQLQDNVDTALAEKLPAMPMDYTVSAGDADHNYTSMHAYTTYTNILTSVSGGGVSVGGNLLADGSESQNIGTSGVKWGSLYVNHVHASNLYQNGYKAWDANSLPNGTGTWEPSVYGATTSGSFSYTRGGRYLRIGDMVMVSFKMQITSVITAPAGRMFFSGLPFIPHLETSDLDVPVSLLYCSNTAITDVQLRLYNNSTSVALQAMKNNAGYSFTASDISANFGISGSFCYYIG